MARTLRFVHAADLHLDSPFKGLAQMPSQLREQVVQSCFEAWDALVRLTKDVQADALLLSGDLHDADNRSLRSQWRLQQGLQQLVEDGVQVFILYGNHDPLSAKQDWEWPAGVTVLGKDQPESYWIRNRLGRLSAVVTGMSYAGHAVYENLAASYPVQPELNVKHAELQDGFVQRPYRIGMLHGTVDGRQDHDPYAPCSKQELIEKGYDYWALGHIHKREVLHQSPWIVYPGNLQGRHLKEAAAKGAYVVDVDDDGTAELHFHPLDSVRWHDEQLTIDGVETRQDMMDLLSPYMERLREENAIQLHLVRVTLTGRSGLHRELMSGSLCAELEEAWREAELLRVELGDTIVWPVRIRADSHSLVDVAAWRESDHFIGEAVRMAEAITLDDAELERLLAEVVQPLIQQRKLLNWTEGLTMEAKRALLNEALHLVVDLLEGEST